MNSLLKFLRRVRIHGGECGAVARALHHKARKFLPAVFKKVLSTTFERKLMSNKTSFKRLALAVIASLGVGVLGTAPSFGAATVVGDTLTLSASSASIGYGETATLTITNDFTSTITAAANAGETVTVQMVAASGGTASLTAIVAKHSTDSANAGDGSSGVMKSTRWTTFAGTNPYTAKGTLANTAILESVIPVTAGLYTKQTINVYFYNANATTTGSTTYTITTRAADGTIMKSAQFTLTTTKRDTTAVATKSKLWLVDTYSVGTRDMSESDSTLVVSAGVAATPAVVGYIYPVHFNAADTKTVTGGLRVGGSESILVTVSGPGTLALSS